MSDSMATTVIAVEAHSIMTLSMKKIVESRGRRGGPSLHRNLLVAGVLFKARDVLLAEAAAVAAATSQTTAESAVDCDATVPQSTPMDTASVTVDTSSLVGKENVPPPTPPCQTSDTESSSTDVIIVDCPDNISSRCSKKRTSRDAECGDDVITPLKSPRVDDSTSDRSQLRRPEVEADVTPVAVADDKHFKTVSSSSSSCSSPESTVASRRPTSRGNSAQPIRRRRNSVVRLSPSESSMSGCLSSTAVETTLIRPLLAVQVV